ncbi:Asp-tRNA(Asn)/Glu-tRNA(Gln) amidotransferase subunit GatB [Candidatus Daviesbacteria bacterium]|nr:Asp-tRNA(Asn)/Glu-tRNA(Gln) amidotransferase subunit GatB [Candidatus Daviesbacteria bacterium]
MNKYQPVIGLEVHVELNTKSKMFCRCSADYFGKEPNTHTCPVCLGLPGALPYINQQAIDDCIKIGLALNCQIAEKSLFERKNYFYPDLPKGYQISQYRWPLCTNGKLMIDDGKIIRINRVHQEEDTGKLTHTKDGTLIDFNRSGVPLVEIVTEPDFTNVEEVREYAKKLQQLFRYLDVSNADMERGDMRLEANVSVKRQAAEGPLLRHEASEPRQRRGESELPNYRVELKNINSFRFMVAAIEHEIKRQITEIEAGKKLTQETRGWNEDKKCTYLQRSKEEAHDYRYFPEPDLPELILNPKKIQQIKSSLPELPWDKAKRYQNEFGIKKADAKILSESKEVAEFFEEAVEHGKKHQVAPQDIANYIVNQKPDITSVLPTQAVEEIKGKKVGVIEDLKELEKLAKKSMEENQKALEDYKKGKTEAIQVLIGGVMKISSGKADSRKVKEVLEKLLKSK